MTEMLTEAAALDMIDEMISQHIENWPKPKQFKTAVALLGKTLAASRDEVIALAERVMRMRAAISWIERPFVDDQTSEAELRRRIKCCVDDAARAALKQGAAS